ncbi:MAG: hypothetical protein CYPHOPRED_006033 [Cyphobasidiales sp. Tagirdzhanova-0007]|nr:MAG: hypothetical protein CYPHOPRED_006033 [Cyphobasidiales sp. Tagirdzhanova-0007]
MRLMTLLSKLVSLASLFFHVVAGVNLFQNGLTGVQLGSFFGTVPTTPASPSYDYIVAGGGTAGLVLAVRLAQNGSTVAVIEPGGFYEVDNGNFSTTPAGVGEYAGLYTNVSQPLIDWGINTIPQSALGGRSVHYAQGKCLGGSSARNVMIYHRPSNGSLQKWADDVGDQSYSPKNFFPFYHQSVSINANEQYISANNTIMPQDTGADYPTNGPLRISFGGYTQALETWMFRVYQDIGMKAIPGLIDGQLLGTAFAFATIDNRNGHRVTSESSYLQMAFNQSLPITIYSSTQAQKILFNEEKMATGVQCMTAGTFGTSPAIFNLTAGKEVIVSAGVFQSPQLLMVSGIGNKTQLESFEIDTISDLPGVGQNLWDHIFFGTSRAVDFITASAGEQDPSGLAEAAELFVSNGTGPLSEVNNLYAWEKLPEPYRSQLSAGTQQSLNNSFPSDWPEVEWLDLSSYYSEGGIGVGDPLDGKQYATLVTALISPFSRGTVCLRSSSMSDRPLVDPAWLSDTRDQEMVVQMFKRTRQAWNITVGLGVADSVEAKPGLSVASDSQILNYIKSSLSTVWHAAGTCKMGLANDSMAVLDSQARVFGVKNLRVVDASSFPFLPPGHPQSTIYAFAEKIAQDILAGAIA